MYPCTFKEGNCFIKFIVFPESGISLTDVRVLGVEIMIFVLFNL